MSEVATIPPPRRPELILSPLGDKGQYVVKDPRTGKFFNFGEQEHFLLARLDGRQTSEAIRGAFEQRFGEPLSDEDLKGFLALARSRGFLLLAEEPAQSPSGEVRTTSTRVSGEPRRGTTAPPPSSPESETGQNGNGPDRARDPRLSEARRVPTAQAVPLAQGVVSSVRRTPQSLLFWRKSLFDPDRLFDWLEPKVRFFWTPAFFVLSAACILAALAIVLANGQVLVSYFADALRWETLAMVALTMIVVTTCHEFAHGLTCKRYGGEVHEIGVLLLFMMPAFYCNVSDAWLFREKSKRIWVTLAGGYCELCVWALAVMVWRLTLQDGLINYLAWVMLSVAGVRVFFNFNPLLKLDGYYLLSDLIEIPNLRQRALTYVSGHLRWLLWGGPRPVRDPRGKFLLGFGVASWLFSIVFLSLMVLGIGRFLWIHLGLVGAGLGLVVGIVVLPRLFHGLFAGEVRKMFVIRHKRTALWVVALAVVPVGLFVPQMEDRVGGTFEMRPIHRAELRAPVAGFLEAVHFDEGDRVSSGALVARLKVLDLTSHISQKLAAVREVEANLRLLEAGARAEEVAEQRQRVRRAGDWHVLAEQDLAKAREALQGELAGLEEKIVELRAELHYAHDAYERTAALRRKNALSHDRYQEAEKTYRVCRAQFEQAQAELRAREALGSLKPEEELARRKRELADALASLSLLEAGPRPEEIEAESARLARLKEEASYLEGLQEKLALHSPIAGLIVTPHLAEKVGQYFEEGEIICEVQDPSGLEAEITLAEQEVARIEPDQRVELKARAMPFQNFQAKVERIAPAAVRGELQSTIIVYCHLEDSSTDMRPGMTGYARIYTGRRPVGEIVSDRILRFLRTEFWW